jgi:predicted ATPase
VVSEATYRVVEGYFTCEALGEHALSGVAKPIAVYRVLRHSGAQSRLDIAGTRGLTPLVGRQQEVGLLLERWEQVQEGMGQVIVLSGEAGIGKSRLVQVLTEHVERAGAICIALRCSPSHTNSALYPVIQHLERLLQYDRDEAVDAKWTRLERVLETYNMPRAEVVPLFATLLSIPPPDVATPLHLSPQQQRQKMHDALVAWLLATAERHPVLMVSEDLQWADPSTLEVLGLAVEQVPMARMLMLLTCRPEFHPPWTPRSHLTSLTLNGLTRAQTAAMAQQVVGGRGLPAVLLEQIVTKTDGVPLFIEELTKVIVESGGLREAEGAYEVIDPSRALAVPTTL